MPAPTLELVLALLRLPPVLEGVGVMVMDRARPALLLSLLLSRLAIEQLRGESGAGGDRRHYVTEWSFTPVRSGLSLEMPGLSECSYSCLCRP